MEKQDSNIATRLVNKDKSVIAEIYDCYATALYGVVLKIVGSESIAEDILQDSFIKIWNRGHLYDSSKGSLFTWLLNITRNTAIDKIRTSHFRQGTMTQSIDLDLHDRGDNSTQKGTDFIGVKNGLEELDEKYRIVIDLIYFQGFTQQEIHEHLGIPLGTVKSRIRIAMRQLKHIFRGYGATIISMLALSITHSYIT